MEELINVAGSNADGKLKIYLNHRRSQRTHRLACKFNLHGFSVDFNRLGENLTVDMAAAMCGGP